MEPKVILLITHIGRSKRERGETMRRYGAPIYGKRFVGNIDKKEVHDLDNEKTGKNECQIDEIKQVRTFNPDTLDQAHGEGYDNCAYCLGGSTR